MQTYTADIDSVDYNASANRFNLEAGLVSNVQRNDYCELTKRNMLIASVDFPLPVRPTKPTRSLALSENETPRRTEGRSGAYLTTRLSTTRSDSLLVLVDDGQYAGGLLSGMSVGGSFGRFKYSEIRSTELRDQQRN